jgi:hypothetical protein
MSIKEQIVRELDQVPDAEPILQEIMALLEARKKPQKTYKGRPVYTLDDLKKMKCPFPPEPDNWAELWEADRKEQI